MAFATWFVLAAAAALIVIVGASWIWQSSVRKSAAPVADPGRSLALVITRFGAIAYAALVLIGTVSVVARTLMSQSVQVALPVEFWPIFLALALLAVTAAFRYSGRLQRDTQGLV